VKSPAKAHAPSAPYRPDRAATAAAALRTATRAAVVTRGLRKLAESTQPSWMPPRAALRKLDGDIVQAEHDGALEMARSSLQRRIRAHLDARLDLVLTDNRYTMISVRRDPSRAHYKLRLHHMFADASPAVTRAIARYVAENDPGSSRMLGDYIDEHQHRVRPRVEPRPRRLVSRGDVHDLQAIFDELNEDYFDGRIDARITWGPRTRRRRPRKSIKMGSYSLEERLIRIHRTLDRPEVPEYFVAWIVFHEMLHQVFEAPVVNGRRQFHPPEFLQAEATYARYAEAKRWERDNLELLLTY